MKTENRVVYIADDGTEFDNERECAQYEKSLEFSYVIQTYIEKYADDYYSSDIRIDIAKALSGHFMELIEHYNSIKVTND